MALTAPVSSRRLRGLAVAAGSALLLPLAAAGPAVAQTTAESAAAASASALRVTVNLPQGNRIELDLSAADGTIRSVTGSGPEAEALATILRGSIAGNAQSFPGAEARLPEPRESSGGTSAISDGIANSPLGQFLSLRVGDSRASVTEAPSGQSTAQILGLGVGLPQALNDGLQQVLDPLLAGIETILTQAGAPLGQAGSGACQGLSPVTGPVGDGVMQIPGVGTLLGDAVDGLTEPEQGLLCDLGAFLLELRAELAASLEDLAGTTGLLSTGLISAEQEITTEGARTTARATAEVADLAVLGVNPFGDVDVLRTTSTASLDGGTAEADVDVTAVEAFAAPVLTLETDLRDITGDLAGIDLEGLNELINAIETVLAGLAGIGIEAGPLDEADATLDACPDTLEGQLSGTFEQDGVCAAAAARGFGLAVTVPAQLAGPLGIDGPLLAVQLVPSAAVVTGTSTTAAAAPPPAEQPIGPLPRTGGEAPLAAAGLAMLLGAAAVRRRRALGDSA